MIVFLEKKASKVIPTWLFSIALVGLAATPAFDQVRSGGAFLKVLPGARHQGMAGSLTGVIDELHALYANPGATGFLRPWQWSAAYTEWIADSYNLSFSYGKQLRTPWSKHTKFALGIQYQGIREFDSTKGAQPSASASDLLMTASFGNPLNFLSKNLSFGANVKYFRSNLANVAASSLILDFGLLYRSNRFTFKKGPFEYGILSVGVALTQLGQGLQFIAEDTPLPRSLRAGAALNMGTHTGLQMQFSADYKNIRDEGGSISFGAEAFLFNVIGLRGGYDFGSNNLSQFSFGMSLRFDGRFFLTKTAKQQIFGRNNGLRIDLAGQEKNIFFPVTYRAGVSHYPVGPEKFEFVDPILGTDLKPGNVQLTWNKTHDPDLYDTINYLLMVEESDSKAQSIYLNQLIDKLEKGDQDLFEWIEKNRSNFYFAEDSGFQIARDRDEVSFLFEQFPAGDYFWSVLAYDEDRHIRFAEKNGERISHFRILPDLQITGLSFDPHSLITEDDYQGELKIEVSNAGLASAKKFSLIVYDSLLTSATNGVRGQKRSDEPNRPLAAMTIKELRAGADTTFKIKWNTNLPGKHLITAIFDRGNLIQEENESNNLQAKAFYTIPKGAFKTKQSVVAQVDTVYEYELPFIPKVYFDHNSSEVSNSHSSLFYSPLETLATRLVKRTDVILILQGSADFTNGESKGLALKRVQAVKDYLVDLGLNKRLIRTPENIQVIFKNPNPQLDTPWVQEERRYVRIFVNEQQNRQEFLDLFHSVPITLPKSKTFLTVPFAANVEYSVPAVSGVLYFSSLQSMRTDTINIIEILERKETFHWRHFSNQRSDWVSQEAGYKIIVKDSLGRSFSTPKQNVHLSLHTENKLPEKIILGMAEFREDTPNLNPDWSNILEKVKAQLNLNRIQKVHFIGHACAIGESPYNEYLSKKRAAKFYEKFKKRLHHSISLNNGETFYEIEIRGEGEHEPFSIEIGKLNFLEVLRKRSAQEYQYVREQIAAGVTEINLSPFILKVESDQVRLESNNNSPMGRQINRRIEILLEPFETIEFTSKAQN